MRRLNQIYKPDAPGLLAAHNDYIREITLRIVRTKDQELLKKLQKWFEVELRGHRVSPNAATYALMIQASLQGSEKKKVDRTIRRFVHLAQDAGVGDETMALISALEKTAEVTSRFFEEPPEADMEAHAQQEIMEASAQPKSKGVAVPAIRAVYQKGSGLLTLKKSLSMFSESASLPDLLSEHTEQAEIAGGQLSLIERQQLLERNTVEAAVDRWREDDARLRSMGIHNILSTSSLGAIMWKWHEELAPSIRKEVQKANEAETKEPRTKADEERLLWGPYLQSLSAEKISAIAILACMKAVSTDTQDERGNRLHHVVRNIGEAINDESVAETLRFNGKYSYWRGLSQAESLKKLTNLVKRRQPHDSLAKLIGDTGSFSQEYDKLEWPMSVKVRIGAMLLSHLMNIAKVEISRVDPKTGAQLLESQPVFFHTYSHMAGKRVGVVRLNSAMMETMTKAPVTPAFAKYLPMVAEPKPWVGFREGGYLEHPVGVVRLSAGHLQAKRYAMTAAENGDMSQVFAGLDVLARTQWTINRGVFDVMLEAWNTGEAIAKIPPEIPTADLPPEPPESASTRERQIWLKQVREIENHKAGLRSQRCFQNFQMEVARAFLNETFYFPHNVDFRGRAYPMAPFLNHMGADNARGLLMFAKGKELTSTGLWWLKVHLANVYGYDKASFQERHKFTEDHLPQILDSAENALDGSRWWLDAEDPWQCLAACNELKNALDLPDPSKYISHLAIHQDGTCNGLQHYAALGGDVAGAKQVNLEPGDGPSDIYTGVAELIKAQISQDSAEGNALARQLDGKITRKVVKQTVMTNVYGVTYIGAKRQVRKQLDAILTSFPETKEVNRDVAASYIAKKIFAALATMFNGAHDIQYWLSDCAGRICESLSPDQIAAIEMETNGNKKPSLFSKKQLKGGPREDQAAFTSSVIWTTPLKMPVVQPYHRRTKRRIETNLQMITLSNPANTDPVHRAKQMQAFPPNFIHSLDGTHMFLTALKCHELGLTFAAVHDSFWTHAGDIDTMNRVIRDAFIRMHSENIIARLRAEFVARHKDYMNLASVRYTTSIGKKIRAWRKSNNRKINVSTLNSAERTSELLLEVRRLRLLASEDPAQREEGEKMITPGSIFAESSSEEMLTVSDDQPPALGAVSKRVAKFQANESVEVGDPENVEAVEAVLGDDAKGLAEDDNDDRDDIDDEGLAAHNGSGLLAKESPDSVDPHASTKEANEIKQDPLDATWIREAEQKKRQRAKENQRKNRKTYFWVPLTFPPVPEKVRVITLILTHVLPVQRLFLMWNQSF